MAFKPEYLVTQFKSATRASRSSEYTGSTQREKFFKVTLMHGYFPGVGVDLYYENEAHASEFSLFQIYDASAIIDRSNILEPLNVLDLKKIKNAVPGEHGPSDAWRVSMESPSVTIDMWTPEEVAARQYGKGKSFDMVDLFGTLPSIPFDIGDELAAKAFRADFAQADLERKLAEAELAKLEADQARQEEVYRSPGAASARAAAAASAAAAAKARQDKVESAGVVAYYKEETKIDAYETKAKEADRRAAEAHFRGDMEAYKAEAKIARDMRGLADATRSGEPEAIRAAKAAMQSEVDKENKADATAAAAVRAKAEATAKAANEKVVNAKNAAGFAKKEATDKVNNVRGDVSKAQWHSITHGGAAGYYDGEFYDTAQFGDKAKLADGQWFGTFVRA